MKDGCLYLNGKQLPMREVGPYDKRADEGGRRKGTLYDVTLPSGITYRIVKQVFAPTL